MFNGLPKSVDTLLLAGAEAHICIFQTAMGAIQAGYKPWIVADAVSSRDKRNAELALIRMQGLGMAVGPTEMAVYELLGIEREIPPILHHDKSLKVNFDAVIKAFK